MAIKPNNQIVLLASEAEDIDAAYDSMEGQQDYVSIGGVEIPVGFDRSENTFYLLDKYKYDFINYTINYSL